MHVDMLMRRCLSVHADDRCVVGLTLDVWYLSGPVFVIMFVGISDIASKTMADRSCGIGWVCIASCFLSVPIFMILFSIIIVKRLAKDGAISFNRNPARPFKQIFADLKEHGNLTSFKGIRRKLSFLFIAVFDKRFAGDWAKKTPKAKFFGFFLGNTGPLWFCFSFVLIKKVFTPIILNWTNGSANAIITSSIFWIDAGLQLLLQGHRDNVVNAGLIFIALGNAAAATLTALPIVLPADLIPGWMSGSVVMFCMLFATGISAITAMLGPAGQLVGALKNVLTNPMAFILPVLVGARSVLLKRFERIAQMRTKKKAQQQVHAEKAEKAGHGDVPQVLRVCVICEQEWNEDEGIACCGTVPDKPIDDEHDHKKGPHKQVHMPDINMGDMYDLRTGGQKFQPPHFTCSNCLAGHVRSCIDTGEGVWHTKHTIPCSLYGWKRVNALQACNDIALSHEKIKRW